MTTLDLRDGDRLILHGLNAPPSERGAVERLSKSGRVWIARPPATEAQDAFIAIRIDDNVVVADSFQGLSLRLDLSTGAVMDQFFVK